MVGPVDGTYTIGGPVRAPGGPREIITWLFGAENAVSKICTPTYRTCAALFRIPRARDEVRGFQWRTGGAEEVESVIIRASVSKLSKPY